MSKPKPHIVDAPANAPPEPAEVLAAHAEQLDAEELEFRKLRRDLPGVKGSSATGIIAIAVTDPDFRPIMPIVDIELGMEKHYFAVTPDMVEPLAAIGISVTDATLYLTVTDKGSVAIVPVRCANADGDQNEYNRTKEDSLIRSMGEWIRIYTDRENKCYRAFPAPVGRFGEPQFPDLKPAKVFRLAFRDRGRLIDNTQHPLFLKWAARDSEQ
jgi:hypothetical protein